MMAFNTRWVVAVMIVVVVGLTNAVADGNQQKDFLFESTAEDEGHLQVSATTESEIYLKGNTFLTMLVIMMDCFF